MLAITSGVIRSAISSYLIDSYKNLAFTQDNINMFAGRFALVLQRIVPMRSY
jgi:hypothetical protein